jgi:hypothetical protein
VTLVEIVVAMSVLSILMAVFMSLVVVMSRATVTTRSIGTSATQLRAVVDALGRQAENASAATSPTVVGTDLYIELRTDAVAAGSAATCVQWRFRSVTRELQSRSWSTLNPSATAWRTIVADLGNDPNTQPPFTVQAADSVHVRPVVTVDLVVHPPGGPTTSLASAYSLRNYMLAPTGPVCAEVARA